MEFVAIRESVAPELVRSEVARGRAIIPANINQSTAASAEPLSVVPDTCYVATRQMEVLVSLQGRARDLVGRCLLEARPVILEVSGAILRRHMVAHQRLESASMDDTESGMPLRLKR
jgi:hypothetical protein